MSSRPVPDSTTDPDSSRYAKSHISSAAYAFCSTISTVVPARQISLTNANIRYREELRDAVAQSIAAGQTLEQAQASVMMEAYKAWDFYEQQRPQNVAGMYRALSANRR